MPTVSSREDEPPTQVVAGASGEAALPPVLLPAVEQNRFSDICVIRLLEGEEMAGWGGVGRAGK